MGRSFTTAIFNDLWDVNMTKGGGVKGGCREEQVVLADRQSRERASSGGRGVEGSFREGTFPITSEPSPRFVCLFASSSAV